MEFRTKAVAALFAGTPPLESLRVLVALLAVGRWDGRKGMCLGVTDVKRAHFHAKAKRRIFVDLPPEDPMYGRSGACGELQRSMYGTRDASANWEAEYTRCMLALGFLLMIGTTLIADGFGFHFPKGYIYTAMAFSVLVEGLNMLSRRARKKRDGQENGDHD